MVGVSVKSCCKTQHDRKGVIITRLSMAVNWVIQVLAIAQVYILYYAACQSESFSAPPPVCPGGVATFTCTVCTTPDAATAWQVEGYTCLVLHSRINPGPQRCGPNDTFVAELKKTEGGCYYSVFNITAHPNLSGTGVKCIVPVEKGRRTVGEGNMDVINAPPPPFFHRLSAGDIAHSRGSNEVTLTLSWAVPDDYRYTENITGYVITATTPQRSRTLSVDSGTTQHSVRVPLGAVVEFTVHAEACGKGRESTPPTVVRAEVPEVLPRCDITAVYNSFSHKLTDIVIRWPRAMVPPFEIAPGLSAEARDYTIFVDGKIVERKHLCTGQRCAYTWKVTDQGPTRYEVSVAANNVVGRGEAVVCRPESVASVNELVDVDVDVGTLNGHVLCTFRDAFPIALRRDAHAYCEIRLGTDPTFTRLEMKRQSREIASAGGENVSINIGPLNATTIYYFNISVMLEDVNSPVVVIQGFVTTPTTCNYSDLVGSHSSSRPTNRTCHIDGGLQGRVLEFSNGEVCYNGTTPGSVANYSCNVGYVLSEDAINLRTCRDDGRWSDSAISCMRKMTPGIGNWLGPSLAAFIFIILCVGGVCLYFYRRRRLAQKQGEHENETEGQKSDAVQDRQELESVEIDGPRISRGNFEMKGTSRHRLLNKNGVANGGGRRRRNGRARW